VVKAHAGWLLVLTAYAASAFLIPILANVAVTDDWVYYRSVETLLVDHVVRVHEMSSAALVFQTVWGAAFAGPLGLSFGALRISTVVLVGLSGIAFYAVCRELGIARSWSAVGMAAYLFHPLSLGLAYTFMTDGQFAALLVVATWLYVRGLRPDAAAPRFIVAGSVISACAVLVRQQGALVPFGVCAMLVLGRRMVSARRGSMLLVQVAAIPALVTLAYLVWLRLVNGTPWALGLFWGDMQTAGASGVIGLMPRLSAIQAMYLGLFVLPLALAMGSRRAWLDADVPRWSIAAAVSWAALVLAGMFVFWSEGRSMPYVGQFVTATGIGPEDLIAARPVLMGPRVRIVLTLACGLAAVLAGVVVAVRLGGSRAGFGSGVGLVLGIGVGQVLGTIPPSLHFINSGGTLDRYLLPLLPLGLIVLLWGMRELRPILPVACAAVLTMALWAVAGTRDHLVFLDTAWSLGEDAHRLGIPDNRLDVGAGWDGLHLYEHPPRSDSPSHTAHAPWWIDLFAPSTDSSYVVAGVALRDYSVVEERTYWSWLQRRSLSLFLLRREDVAGPPEFGLRLVECGATWQCQSSARPGR